MKKKILALLLALSMTVNYIPMFTIAQGDGTVDPPSQETQETQQPLALDTKQVLTCEAEEHTHGEDCRGELICQISESEGHTHDAALCGTEYNQICAQEQCEPHAHTGACLGDPAYTVTCTIPENHTHGDGCYEPVKELKCTLPLEAPHVHGDGCYITACTQDHEHTPECPSAETPALSCDKTVDILHTHDENTCFSPVLELVCTNEEEDHTHGDDCYKEKQDLICEIPENHTHGDPCKTPNILCATPVTEGHTHNSDCFETVYQCGQEESQGHAHDNSCYAVSCDKTEHTHGAECYITLCAECEEPEGHKEDCSKYVAPAPECTCGAEADETGNVTHGEECELYVEPSLFDKLMALETAEELYYALLEIEDPQALTVAEIDALLAKLEDLPYENEEAHAEAQRMLLMLKSMHCTCGAGMGEEHGEDCPCAERPDAETYATITVINGTATWKDKDVVNDLIVQGNSKITLEDGATVTLNGKITIPKDITLTIVCKGSATLQRGTANSDLFKVVGKLEMSATGGKITIEGGDKETNGAAFLVGDSGVKGTSCTLNNVTIQNCRRQKDKAGNPSGSSAAISVIGNGYENSNYELTMDDCIIQNCFSGHGSALYLHGDSSGIATLTNTTIRNCVATGTNTPEAGKKADGQGGIIRTNGGTGARLTLRNCILENNWSGFTSTDHAYVRTQANGGSACYGGGIYWNAAGSVGATETAKAYVIDCTFRNNHANHSGGAIFNETQMEITGDTVIDGNTAYGYKYTTAEPHVLTAFGGGVAVPTYKGGSKSGLNQNVTLTLGTGVVIKNNKSVNGGGFAMAVQKTDDKNDGVTFDVNIDGAVFENNEATRGGAIHVEKSYSGYYSNVNLIKGTISGNSATDGGAVYVNNVNVIIGQEDDGPVISENRATNGAVIYLNNIPYSEEGPNPDLKHSVTINNGQVSQNTASQYGGSIYVSGGDLTMNDGLLSQNTATNGGAVYVSGGNITLNGGSIVKCVAIHDPDDIQEDKQEYTTGLGGAVYVTGGSMTMLGGEMSDNHGINGGAVYITKTGEKSSDFTMISGKMHDNGSADGGDATEYGGAVFVKGGNIVIGIEECTGNGKNDDIPNHTDGAYTHLPHPEMINNTAKFGGALSVSGGNAEVHCGTIKNNSSDNAGTGMNIFMNGGDLTHDLDSSDIGGVDANGDDDHGIVCVGGSMKVESDTVKLIIKLDYHSNEIPDKNGIEIVWQGSAPDDYWLNLPWCPQDWEDYQNKNNLTFVGWTENVDNADAEHIRLRTDYFPIGDNFRVDDTLENIEVKEDPVTGKKTYTMHLYAVWAPLENLITYAYSLDSECGIEGSESLNVDWTGTIKANGTDDVNIFAGVTDSIPQSYRFTRSTEQVNVPDPSVPGYKFIGWKMYANTTKISNWGMDAYDRTAGESGVTTNVATNLSQINNRWYALSYNWSGKVQQNFGDIVLVAVFKEIPVTIGYELVNHADDNGCTFNGTKEVIGQDTGKYINLETGKFIRNDQNEFIIGAKGATVTAQPGRKVVGWFLDEACTQCVPSDWVTGNKSGMTIKPQKGTDGLWDNVTYYALVEYDYGDLVITTENLPADHSYIFTVTGTPLDGNDFAPLTVIIEGNSSRTIKNVPVGTYLVTEQSGWTWRYTVNGDIAQEEIVSGSDTPVAMFNSYTTENQYWLDDNSYRKK